MIPNTKISETILSFGKTILTEIHNGDSRAELELALRLVVAVWNAVTIDSWNGNAQMESELLKAIDTFPKQIQLKLKGLIKRKKKFFLDDFRAVGEYWIREKGGEFIFGCDARANIKKMPVSEPLQ